ncbi:hypothetical protein PR003_g28472 [Phytophthora rubi]|uniref:CCHC-type domain-containing protein n=1 Tax=Phytophthora rubi TaxID=129364 RepID=A0A6A3J4P6_9STRA|nr:hypothetical protein PR001_g22604 [Phytophthora rubi]KAE9278606.1 hypothetical protein PR003_g28472 [Phytophthora rubi]
MKTPRAAEDVSPNLRPRQQTRLDEEINMGDAHDARAAGSPEAAASNGGTIPPRRSSGSAPANTPSQATSQAAPAPDVTTQIMQMMMMQEQAIQAQQQQFQAFLHQQALFQREIFESQARANTQKQKADPPKFNGKSSEDLELWLFHIEEHLSAYASERNSPDSRFVDMVVPFLSPEAMSWYREFKNTLGDSPRVWAVFKQQIRLRFRDSNYDYKLLSKLHNLRVSGTQQDYTSKFMLLLSQSSMELPEMVKRWFYQQNLRADTSCHISQNIPKTLQEAIEHAQRFEDARSARPRDAVQPVQPAGNKKPGRASTAPTTRPSTDATKPPIICHRCGEPGHIAPACPNRGTTGMQKSS